MGKSIIVADFDFETYSPAGFVWCAEANKWKGLPNATAKGLPVVGAAVYTEHPDAEVLSLAYNLKDGTGVHLWTPNDPAPIKDENDLPYDLFWYLSCGYLIEAWNVGFERWVWNNICVPKYGFPPLPDAQLRCAMAKARAHALPGSLEKSGEVLRLTNKKDKEGKRLITKFCIPRDPTKTNPLTRNIPLTSDDDAVALYRYNMQDIITEAEASSLVPDLSPEELEIWQCDQRINARGVQVDAVAVQACIKIIEQAYEKYNAELFTITSGSVSRASEIAKLLTWVNTQGVRVNSLNEETITALLMPPNTVPPPVRRALEIRQLIGLASVKKLYAMSNQMSRAGRLHDLFIYHSARTGRAAGAGPQPQNLPNSGPEVWQCPSCKKYNGTDFKQCTWCLTVSNVKKPKVEWNSQAVEDALEIAQHGNLELLEYYFGDAVATVSGCLRGMFIAKPGHDLISSDYSAIEAVVAAMLSGETWRINVFRTHGKIYEMSASKITGTPFEEYERHHATTGQHHADRKLGKIAELASGFGGWIDSWKKFGADEFLTEEQIKNSVLAWRQASPLIVEMWGGQKRNWNKELYGLEGMAVCAIMNPGVGYGYRDITYTVHQNVLYCRLPSGRHLTYHNPRLVPSTRKYREDELQIVFEGWNSNPMKAVIGWTTIYTYGPQLFENVVQAVARDILMHGLVNLEKAGYPIVLHVHDEALSEVPENFGSIEEFERIMSTMPTWGTDYPIRASGGWRGKRYRK